MGERTEAAVLVCDADDVVRRGLCATLTSQGHPCLEARSAEEARSLLVTTRPAVTLIDAAMVGQGGPNYLAEFVTLCPDAPVIVMSSGDDGTAARYVKQGAYDFITKPVDTEEAIVRVKRALETRQLKVEAEEYRRRLANAASDRTFLGAMSALSFALEAKDSYTAGHSRRVADVSVALGKHLGLGESALESLRWGSLLHDLAKIAVDESVLHKNGKLTASEYEHVMTHPLVGACLAASLVQKQEILDIIQHHHSHYDGSGLRQRVAGAAIPLLARIVAVADAYDAMTSDRPYRPARSRDEALGIIRSEIGRQFDPRVATALLELSSDDISPKRDTVLIADDDESIRMLVRSILGNDFAVIEAADGRQAVEISLREKPSLVLMDILMPGEDGLQACRDLKANPETSDIPVVMLTGADEESSRGLSRSVGAARFLTKPFTPQILLDTVRAFAGSGV